MNEEERAKKFSAALDNSLNSDVMSQVEITSDEERRMLEITRRLASADFSADRPLYQTLRSRLLHTDKPAHQGRVTSMNHRYMRTFAVAVIALIILLVAILTVPPLRALAQEILGRFGWIVFTNEQTDAQRHLAGSPAPTFVPDTPAAVPEATEGDLPFYTASYLPDGYELNSQAETQSDYSKPLNDDFGGTYMLSIQQERTVSDSSSVPVPYPVGDATVTDVTVRGYAGIWIEQAPIGVQADAEAGEKPIYVNILVWEENGILFIMRSFVLSPGDVPPALPLDEMLHIAESLTPTP